VSAKVDKHYGVIYGLSEINVETPLSNNTDWLINPQYMSRNVRGETRLEV